MFHNEIRMGKEWENRSYTIISGLQLNFTKNPFLGNKSIEILFSLNIYIKTKILYKLILCFFLHFDVRVVSIFTN